MFGSRTTVKKVRNPLTWFSQEMADTCHAFRVYAGTIFLYKYVTDVYAIQSVFYVFCKHALETDESGKSVQISTLKCRNTLQTSNYARACETKFSTKNVCPVSRYIMGK